MHCWIIALGVVAAVTFLLCFHCALAYKSSRRSDEDDTVATNDEPDKDFDGDVESPNNKLDDSSYELTNIVGEGAALESSQ
jgi:hypothetical protein